MRTLIITIVLSLITSSASAQWWNFGGGTVQGNYLNGWGRAQIGNAAVINAWGQAGINSQVAESMRLDNEVKRAETFWAKRGVWKKNTAKPNWIEQENRRLDLAEQRFDLEQRRAALRDKGVLPPKPEQKFFRNGVAYNSYKDFVGTDEWKQMVLDSHLRELQREVNKELDKQKYDAAGIILKNRGW